MGIDTDGVYNVALVSMLYQASRSLSPHVDDLRTLNLALMGAMDTLTEGTSGWEGEASKACQQLWFTLFNHIVSAQLALAHVQEALTGLIHDTNFVHDDPTGYAHQYDLLIPDYYFFGFDIPIHDSNYERLQHRVALIASVAPSPAPPPTPSPAPDLWGTVVADAEAALAATEAAAEGAVVSIGGVFVAAAVAVGVLIGLAKAKSDHDQALNDLVYMHFFASAAATMDAITKELPQDLPAPSTMPNPDSSTWSSTFVQVETLSESFGMYENRQINALMLTPQYQQTIQRLAHFYGVSYQDMLSIAMATGFNLELIERLAADLTNDQGQFRHKGISYASFKTMADRIKNGTISAADAERILQSIIDLRQESVDIQQKDPGSARGHAYEAETIELLLDYLTNAHYDIYRSDQTKFTDIDIETPCLLIDTTVSPGGKRDQVTNWLTPRANPHGKTIIIYGKNYTSGGEKDLQDIANDKLLNPLGLIVKVIRTATELLAEVQKPCS